MSLRYLVEFGWEAKVLAVKPEAVEGMPIDQALAETVPHDLVVHAVGALPTRLTRAVGLGNVAMRALPALWKRGSELLRKGRTCAGEKVDLVFFSTTQFPVMILGPIWKRQFGVPYVIDMQDPWRDNSYKQSGFPPPGGRFRYGLSRVVARLFEPQVMRYVGQVIVVSGAYTERLKHQYPWLRPSQFHVLPFGAPEHDFEMLKSLPVTQQIFDAGDGKRHVVYMGVAGKIMETGLRLLFSGLSVARKENPAEWSQVRVHFVGTSYAPAGRGRKTVEPVAAEFGIADIVEERTDRIGYFDTLAGLSAAQGLLIIGSNSPSYTPSKIYPYVLSKRPLLAILHEQSPAVEILERCRAGIIIKMNSAGNAVGGAAAVTHAIAAFRRQIESGSIPDTDWRAFEPYTAREMTRRQCEVFDLAVAAAD
jgi:hypothetical protein